MQPLTLDSNDLWQQINNAFGKDGGCYKLHCFAPANGGLVPIQRVLGTDMEGVLYIGKATTYVDRVIDLKKGLSPEHKSEPHVAGRRYWNDQHAAFREAFPFGRLCVTLVPSPAPERTERELLDSYCRQFGEGPPLNSLESGVDR